MKKSSILDNLLLLAVTFLFALVLTGCCGSAPDPEAELAACGAAMDALQEGSYHITTRRNFVDDGYDIEFEHWKHGKDWMDLSKHENIDVFFATLYCEGQAFVNMGDTELDRLNDIQWNPCPDTALQSPLWLENCRWEDQQVRLVSSKRNGRVVTVQFLTPYQTGDQTAGGYTVEFHFDKKGELEKAVMAAVFQNSNGGEGRWVDEMIIRSTDPEEVSAGIAREYQRATEQNGDPDTQEALDACGAVLKELQSHDSYHLHEETDRDGMKFTKDTLRTGDGFYYYSHFEEDGKPMAVAVLRRNGRYFGTEWSGKWSTPGNLYWAEVPALEEYEENYTPWLYTCDWDAQDVKLLSDTMKGGERTISVQIDTPYTYPSSTRPVAVGYTVEFHFDRAGNFTDMVMVGSFHHKEAKFREYDYLLNEKASIVTTAPEKVAAEIDGEYQRALEQN